MKKRVEDDMKRTWNEQMKKIQHALKLKECKEKKTRLIWLGVSHHVHLSCTKYPMDITIAIPAIFYPKTIQDMVPFEFANTVANSNEFQGAECKVALIAF